MALVLAALAPSAGCSCSPRCSLGSRQRSPNRSCPWLPIFPRRQRRGATVGTILAGILTGILLSRTLAGFVATHRGWREMFWLGVPMAMAGGFLMM